MADTHFKPPRRQEPPRGGRNRVGTHCLIAYLGVFLAILAPWRFLVFFKRQDGNQKAEPISSVTVLADKEILHVANVQLLNLMDSENTLFLLKLQNDRKEITFEKNDLPFLDAPSSKAGGFVGSGKQDFYLAWSEGEKSFHAFCLLASTKIIMKFECKEIPFGLTTEDAKKRQEEMG